MVIRFGKYKGRTVKWVMYNDRRYFEWAKDNAPSMFESYKPTAKPSVSDTKVGETQPIQFRRKSLTRSETLGPAQASSTR